MRYWLVKTEPEEYSYDDLERQRRDMWDGVRNALAQRHLREMKPGDQVLVYHSGKERAIVGVAQVVSNPYPDPTDGAGRSSTVDISPMGRLHRPISLAEVKQVSDFAEWELVRLPRLSVMPVPEGIWQRLMQLAQA